MKQPVPNSKKIYVINTGQVVHGDRVCQGIRIANKLILTWDESSPEPFLVVLKEGEDGKYKQAIAEMSFDVTVDDAGFDLVVLAMDFASHEFGHLPGVQMGQYIGNMGRVFMTFCTKPLTWEELKGKHAIKGGMLRWRKDGGDAIGKIVGLKEEDGYTMLTISSEGGVPMEIPPFVMEYVCENPGGKYYLQGVDGTFSGIFTPAPGA